MERKERIPEEVAFLRSLPARQILFQNVMGQVRNGGVRISGEVSPDGKFIPTKVERLSDSSSGQGFGGGGLTG